MSPLSPLALKALLFTASFAAGALLLRPREAHCCDPAPCLEELGEQLTLRPIASRVDGVARPLPSADAGAVLFAVANDWLAPNDTYATAKLFDPEQPATPRERLVRRQP